MTFILTKVVVHEVIKKAKETGSRPFLTNELLPIDDNTTYFVQQLNKSFGKDNINYGVFDPETDAHIFRDGFENLNNSKYLENEFIKFSRNLTTNLSDRMDSVVGAKGGYLVFAEYASQDVKYIGVFFVRDTERVLLKREGVQFTVSKIENVDTDQLAMACRIVRAKYEKSVHGYLQFIKNNQERISEYFLSWIAAYKTTSSRELTDIFVKLIEEIGVGLDADGNEFENIDDFHKAVTTYINATPNNVVNLKDVGEKFYGDGERITNYADQNDVDIDREFRANGTGLRKLFRLEFKNRSLQLKFSRGDWSKKTVRVVNDRIIIDDPKLAQKILTEFSENE